MQLLVVLYFLHFQYVTACTIPGNKQGNCMPSEKCKPYTDAMEVKPLQNVEFIRHLQCKYENSTAFVCCPDSGEYIFVEIPKPTKKKVRVSEELSDRFDGTSACGEQVDPDRIFNGLITGIDEFPWMALLSYKRKLSDGKPILACGGVLVSLNIVLTAAHCVTGPDVAQIGGVETVRLGEYDIENNIDCVTNAEYEDCADPIVEVAPEKIVPHPDYDPRSRHQHHDIAVIKLERSVRYTDFIRPICLPEPTDTTIVPRVDEVLQVSGWGKTARSFTSPVKLKLGVPLVGAEQCQKVYQKFRITLNQNQICAGGELGKDSCKGDSGGPLMKTDPVKGKWITTGVVSIGPNRCGQAGIPGIYTNVLPYVEWIKEFFD